MLDCNYGTLVTGKYGQIKKLQIVFTGWCKVKLRLGQTAEIMSVLEKCHNGAVLGKKEKSHKGAACLF